MIIVVIIVIAILSIGGAWYLAGRILNSSQEKETSENLEISERADIWQGFLDARVNHPPAFEENDTWGVLA